MTRDDPTAPVPLVRTPTGVQRVVTGPREPGRVSDLRPSPAQQCAELGAEAWGPEGCSRHLRPDPCFRGGHGRHRAGDR